MNALINTPDTVSDQFWADQAERLEWFQPFHTVRNTQYGSDYTQIEWYLGGQLNACYNAVDRHLTNYAERTAFIWEPDTPGESIRITYSELHAAVCRVANSLRALGVQRGDVVTVYMPMIPEAVYTMLACARIGAVHSVVFGGFSAQALRDRIVDCQSQWVVTTDVSWRGGKAVALKANVDQAVDGLTNMTVLVFGDGPSDQWVSGQDYRYSALAPTVDADCDPVPMDAEDPLFILYTSGSTGKPKGIVHTTGGYLVYAAMTHQCVFDYQLTDVYWCTADIGWITGHTYGVYGPLVNAATSVIFEGVPTYPDAARCWEIVDRHDVSIFYTAPTAIRTLMAAGDDYLGTTHRRSLRVLGSVGEPINPVAWQWYRDAVGHGKVHVVDTWWQTETGGVLIAPIPGHISDPKPGFAMQPLPGIQPVLVDESGQVLEGACDGFLCLVESWPGQMRTIVGDHQRFLDTYFKRFDGYYFTGDGATRDAEGNYKITGRVDDVLNVSGHRLGTAEIESALVAHPMVAEAAVVGVPHAIKGEGVYAYVCLMEARSDVRVCDELMTCVRDAIGPIAKPDCIQIVSGLPKTRSGKIMRRILRAIAAGNVDDLGDISTLLDPDGVAQIIADRQFVSG